MRWFATSISSWSSFCCPFIGLNSPIDRMKAFCESITASDCPLSRLPHARSQTSAPKSPQKWPHHCITTKKTSTHFTYFASTKTLTGTTTLVVAGTGKSGTGKSYDSRPCPHPADLSCCQDLGDNALPVGSCPLLISQFVRSLRRTSAVAKMFFWLLSIDRFS
jgi:hypothetical protein